MELYLQFGYGMKSLTLDLAKKWKHVSTILSPRDIAPQQLINWSAEFHNNGIDCLFDPQCFCPKSEHAIKHLKEYSYWDKNLNTHLQSSSNTIENLIKEIKKYNDIVRSTMYILPSVLNDYDVEWAKRFTLQTKRCIFAGHKFMGDKPMLATLALPKDFLVQNENIIEPWLQEICDFNVEGFYFIAETPERKYLVDNPIWLANILHICATLKIAGKKIVFGYGNHQLLALSLLKTDVIASGTWLNVRSFTNRFIDTDEQKRKTTWVYYPEALSEYKMSFIDWAFNKGYLDSMKSKDKKFLDDNINKIFNSTSQPSLTSFKETDAFKHYLCCLNHQVELLNKSSYEDTLRSYEMLLTTAEREIERLEEGGVYGQQRSFRDVIDVNRAAISDLNSNHGAALKIAWNKL